MSGSYDLLLTQRLIAQPELEMNFYSKQDPARGIGTGLSDLDTAIRLRYEFSRKLAPYVGFAYDGKFGGTATFARQAGESVADRRFVFGLRSGIKRRSQTSSLLQRSLQWAFLRRGSLFPGQT